MRGKNQHAVELGKLGRKRNTEKQKEAARRNGRKGGRPKKFNAQETIKRVWNHLKETHENK